MEKIEVMPVGSLVTIADDIPATITGIAIDAKYRITYRCVWWDCQTRTSEWLEKFEVSPADETERMVVGFQAGD